MKKNVKNENNNNINNIFDNLSNDLKDLIKYGKWELTLISSLKAEKNYKKNLLLIDKEWLYKWKEISGYNYIKSQIFKYLLITQKKSNENINEEKKKLNDLWYNIKKKYKINLNNEEKLPKINNKKYLLTINNKTIINGKENFDIISNDIYDIFKKYLENNINIKVGGLFTKKKLLMPFNYNDKNINYIYIDMLFIKDNKNNFEEILFVFPNLSLSIIEKIRKDISIKEINEFIKDLEIKENEKEYIFNDEEGTQIKYKAIYKNNIFKNVNNKEFNTNNKIKYNNINNFENLSKINEINEIKEINDIIDINIIKNFDINNLNYEELQQKMKEIEIISNKLIDFETNLQNKEKIYSNEKKKLKDEKEKINNNNKNKKINLSKGENNLKTINFEEERKKYNNYLKEMEFKNQHLFDEIQEYQEKENKLNNEYKKVKNEFQRKENDLDNKINEINNKEKIIKSKGDHLINNLNKKEIEIKIKEEKLKIKEEELNKKENKLNEKEIEINNEENENKEKIKEIKIKNEEILKKLKILKNKEDMEEKKINDELNEEINELEEQMNENDKNIKNKKSEEEDFNKEEENEEEEKEQVNKTIDDESENENMEKENINESKNFKSRKIKSMNQEISFHKINKKERNSININYNKEKKNKSINDRIIQTNFFSSKALSSPNINDDELPNIPIKINKNKPSLGLTKFKESVNLNAIIQCFAHLLEITEGILNLQAQNFFKEENKNKLSESYAILINNLFFPEKYNNNSGVYSIDLFYNLNIKENKKLLNNNFYINSKYLLNFLIEGLHKELNTKKNINIFENKQFEEINEKDALYKYLQEFTKNNNSIISKNFFGLLKNKIICQGCKKEKYNFKCYSYLYFNLSEIKKFSEQDKNCKNIKLKDCFDYYNKPEYLIGENGLYCNNCKTKNTTTILKSIYSSHTIMPIIFERGEDSNLNKEKIDFPDELDLTNYVEYQNSSKHFFLCGVVSNFGLSNNFGKFEAFCKMEKNDKWLHYNNEQVSSCTNEDIHNKGIQYILFYHKI